MNRLFTYFIFIIHVFCFKLYCLDNVHYDLVVDPNLQNYQSLFCTFKDTVQQLSTNPVMFNDLFNQEFEQEVKVYNKKPENIFLLQAKVFDEVVGFFSCEMILPAQFLIRQMAFDINKYGDSLLKDVLLSVFDVMPNIEKISVVCPVECKVLTDLLFNFGFVATGTLQNHLTDTFSLLVHSKCGMCQVLYGDDFWDQDEDFDLQESYDDRYDQVGGGMKKISKNL